MLNFIRNCQTTFQKGCIIYTATRNIWVLVVLHFQVEEVPSVSSLLRDFIITVYWIFQMLFSCCSVTKLCLTLCDPMNCSMPDFSVHHYLLEFAQTHSIESVMPFSHLILYLPLFLLASVSPSIRVFSNESVLCIRWSNYWSFSFSNEYAGYWFPLGLTGLISL